MNSEKSSLAVTGGDVPSLSPKAACNTFAAVSTTPASFITALPPSVKVMSGAGASDIAAAAFAVRSIPASILARRSGMDRADREDAEFGRIFFAADHALHVHDETRCDDYGIDGPLRRGAMTATAMKGQIEAVRVRGANACAIAEGAVGKGSVVQGKAEIRLFESREQAIGQHRLGARQCFFRGLGDEHQRATPSVLQTDQRLGRANPARHVNVVAAAMVDEGLLPVPVGLVVTGIGKPGLLFHRQRVELGAHRMVGPSPFL